MEKEKVCLIGCVKKKASTETKVRDLYLSPLFKHSLAYAEKNFKHVGVLSALHGLMDLDDIRAPYEFTLNEMKAADIKEWADKVTVEIKEKYPPEKFEYAVIAGRKYHKYLSLDMEILFELPIGKKLSALKNA